MNIFPFLLLSLRIHLLRQKWINFYWKSIKNDTHDISPNTIRITRKKKERRKKVLSTRMKAEKVWNGEKESKEEGK
jgi:hypothetical protein